MIDRFRALPMARSAVLAGRTVADAVRNLFVLALMTIVGVPGRIPLPRGPGRRSRRDQPGPGHRSRVLLDLRLLGLLVREPESAGIGGLLAAIPLVFTSSTFVPMATFPGWLQAFAKVNPITVTVDTIRALCLGGPTAGHVWLAVAWVGGLLVVTVPAATVRYHHTTAG